MIFIRDNIYNYIYCTEIESHIIDHKLFQRLRYITQNGTAYLTYPSNRNDRFMHSLGCMHVGSLMYLNMIQKSGDVVKGFLRDAEKLVDFFAKRLSINPSQIANLLYKSEGKALRKYGFSTNSLVQSGETSLDLTVCASYILFQSIRISCLSHDLGHFPYSHTFEEALNRYLLSYEGDPKNLEDLFKVIRENSNSQIHEQIGYLILEEICKDDKNIGKHLDICKQISEAILKSEDETYLRETGLKEKEDICNILHVLKTIVSSSIDADRLDYCKRDPFASGLEFGAFDLTRLIENFVIFEDNQNYISAFKIQALSSIESFYHQRYQMYKYLIYHHNKQRMDSIIQEIALILISVYTETINENKIGGLKRILEINNFDKLFNITKDVNDYFYCNENWFFSILQNVYIYIKEEYTEKNTQEVDAFNQLGLLIETFLYRIKENMLSVFKRRETFIEFVEILEQKLNIGYEQAFKKLNIFLKMPIKPDFKKMIWDKYEIILLMSKTNPKILDMNKDESVNLNLLDDNRLVELNRYSPYLMSLVDIQNQECFGNIFLISKNIKEKKIYEAVKEDIIEYIIGDSNIISS